MTPLFIAKLFLLWLGGSFILAPILLSLFRINARDDDPPQHPRHDQPDGLR